MEKFGEACRSWRIGICNEKPEENGEFCGRSDASVRNDAGYAVYAGYICESVSKDLDRDG